MMPGFERVTLDAQCARFVREAERTAPSYGMRFGFSAPEIEAGVCPTARLAMKTQGDGWESRAEVVFYDLPRINAIYDSRPLANRLASGFASLFELFFTGTAFSYLRDGWRFYLFYLFPFVFALVSITLLVVLFLPAWLHSAMHLVWAIPLACAGLVLLLWIAKRFHLPLTMDLWTLTTDTARARRPAVAALLREVVQDAARRIAATDAEEVIVVGHSYGVVPAMMALAEPLVCDVAARKPVGLIAAGSYLLAVARHPAAKALRNAVAAIVKARIAWLDAQSHTDPVNFFRTNPATALGATDGRMPSIIEVRFKHQLTPQGYKRIRGDFFRTHRQFVFGVEKRSPYALFAIIGGPEPFEEVVRRPGLADDWRDYETCSVPDNRPSTRG